MSDLTAAAKAAREPIEHELKTWPEPFQAVKSGAKPFEYRRADRDYRVGDTLWLREWQPSWPPGEGDYTGDEMRIRVTFMLNPLAFGVPKDFCVMGLEHPERLALLARVGELEGERDGLEDDLLKVERELTETDEPDDYAPTLLGRAQDIMRAYHHNHEIAHRQAAALRASQEALDVTKSTLEEIAEHPGPNADEAAHWRADAARQTLAQIRGVGE